MPLKLKLSYSTSVVSIAEFKAVFPSVRSTDDAIEITIKAAESAAEFYLNRAVPTRARRIWLHAVFFDGPPMQRGSNNEYAQNNEYPSFGDVTGREIEIEPFTAVIATSYNNKNEGTEIEPKLTVPEDGYILFDDYLSGYRRKYSVKVDYICGWTPTSVPGAVKEFVLRIAGELANFSRPASVAYKFPEHVRMIADEYKRPTLGAGGRWRTW